MGRAPCCDKKEGLIKKGAWTAEEDEKLLSFIRNNNGAHGSWRSLPQLAGLQRCGKSCRLRWANYLRPNIKRGNFSAEEETTITQLHSILGNKWSSIAGQLPGRTDNEVKNHWNTHLKKRLSSMGIDPATHRPMNILNNTCISLLISNKSNNNNSIVNNIANNTCISLLDSNNTCISLLNSNNTCISLLNNSNNNMINPMQSRSSSNCSSSSPRLTRMPLLDQSYFSHMAQWEVARLEAEARLASTSSSSARLLCAATREKLKTIGNINKASGSSCCSCSGLISSPLTYNSSSRREGDHDHLFQDFPELLDMGAAAAADAEIIAHENSALLHSFESSSCISSACVISDQAQGEYKYSEELMRSRPAASAEASMVGGSPEAEITSDLTDLLPDDYQSLAGMMMSPGPIPALMAPDQPCEASHAYWANVLSGLVGPVMSCPS